MLPAAGGRTHLRIGLIDVDSHNWPNLALMKISAYHKSIGDHVEWWDGFAQYDRAYMSRVFDDTYSVDEPEPCNAAEIVKGGTGYSLQNTLVDEIEHMMPDYGLYHWLPQDTAYGFLTRGCPRDCEFCIVTEKEGRKSKKVADLSEFWAGQKRIKLLDPNLLACPEHIDLLKQLANSGAQVDFTQGLDARLLSAENISLLNSIRIKEIHFAWDHMRETDAVLRGLRLYTENGHKNRHGDYGTVYVLTNFDTSMQDNLYRIYTLRDMGYTPYVMIYDKPHAPRAVRFLQRWCNNRQIFRAQPDLLKYNPKPG